MTTIGTRSDAIISPCGTYRYKLSRRWGPDDAPACAFIMLNPSTADASIDDPTIRRACRFAESWNFGAVDVFNLFALRSTDPRDLRNHPDPVGPENDAHLRAIGHRMIVAAWGCWGEYRGRGLAVRRIIRDLDRTLHYLKLTRQGHPAHPLYLPKTLAPIPWELV